MIKKTLLMLSIASATQAMQSLDDESLSVVSGQAGVTINYLSNDAAGKILTASEIRYTENDRSGLGDDDYIAFSNISLSNFHEGASDDIIFKFDVDSAGNARIETSDIEGLTLRVEDVYLSSRSIGGFELNVLNMMPNSYFETIFRNNVGGAEIGINTKLIEGSSLNFKYLEDYALSADVIFKGSTAQTEKAFITEMNLSADANGVKLLLGNTEGSVEVNKIILRDENLDTDLLGGQSFGDIGIGDITITPGSYISAGANTATTTSEGLAGKINYAGTIGNIFFRTNTHRMNFNDIAISTNGDISYTMDQVSMPFVNGQNLTGIRSTISDVTDIDFIINGVNFSASDGTGASDSFSAFGIENLSFNGGALNWDIYTLPGSGSKGVLMDINFPDNTSFNFTITDDPDGVEATPDNKLSTEVVINNLTIQSTVDVIPEGLHVGIMHMSADMNLNVLNAGNGQRYQGSLGRVVVNNMSMRPGSYTRVAPIAP